MTATFEDGRVQLSREGGPNSDLVKTESGRFFVGPAGATDMSCGWEEYQPTALCGREVGGCGGFGSAVSCSWKELAGNRCDVEPNDGGPAD